MICPNAGPLGRTVEYPQFWFGIITAPHPYQPTELVIPARLVDDVKAARPSLNVRLAHS